MGKFSLPKLASGVTENPAAYVGGLGEVTYDSATKLASTHDAVTPGGNTLLPANYASALQDIVCYPTGNAGVTKSSQVVQVVTRAENANDREFAVMIGLTSFHGFGGVDGNDKCALYVGGIAFKGSGRFWGFNPLASYNTPDAIDFHVIEADGNMEKPLRFGMGRGVGGDSLTGGMMPDGTVFNDVSAHNTVITGVATVDPETGIRGHFNSGITVGGATALHWNGFATAYNAAIQNAYLEASVAHVGMRFAGSNVDTINTEYAAPALSVLHMSAGQRISSSSLVRPTQRISMMQVDSEDNLVLGGGDYASAANVIMYASNLPASDNAYVSGTISARWKEIWCANGLNTASDPSLKTDMEVIAPDDALDLLDDIDGWSYRWISGGAKMISEKVTRTVQAEKPVTVEKERTFMIDGVPTRVWEPVVEYQRDFEYEVVRDVLTGEIVYDEYEITEKRIVPAPSGGTQEVMVKTGEKGKNPRLHPVPVMVDKEFEELVPVDQEGKRLHRGWNAAQIRDAFAKRNLDFGGYVLGEDGIMSLREAQLVPILWQATKGLKAILNGFGARLAALEAPRLA